MYKRFLFSLAVVLAFSLPAIPAVAQMDLGPKVEKTYGIGLPRDHASQLFKDADYPMFALKPGQEAYRDIDGARMKRDVIALSKISLKHRDTVNRQMWGRFPGTAADREGVKYMTDEFERLGMTIKRFPYTLPKDWRPENWSASYTAAEGTKIDLQTAFPISGTPATPPQGLTAEVLWLGTGAEADFIGRDVKGKAVVIYSTFVPGGRSHSASDRSGLFNANSRAQRLGAAMVINIIAVPGNGMYQPEDALTKIPHITVSQDEGFALRDRLGKGEKITLTLNLNIPPLTNIPVEYTIATLPGMSDEEINLQIHTDNYFQGATDNNSGMAAALELARHYAVLPKEKRPRTLTFLMFPDHHHGEVAHRMKGGIDQSYDWNRVALKLTLEHPSETLLYMYNSDLTATNALSAVRWNALGSVEFERMVFSQLREFGVSVYGVEDTPKNGNYAPSFHIINHVVYHTTLDTPEMVPAEGMQRSVRAFAAIIDRVNAMTLEQLRGPGFPPKGGRGTVKGPIGM